MADADDPRLVLAFCELCLTSEVRTQDAPFLLRRALTNRHASAEVWALLTDRWDHITTVFPSNTVPRIFEGIRVVTDRALAASIAAFLDANPVSEGATVVRQHVERMWVTVALADRVPAQLAAALR